MLYFLRLRDSPLLSTHLVCLLLISFSFCLTSIMLSLVKVIFASSAYKMKLARFEICGDRLCKL